MLYSPASLSVPENINSPFSALLIDVTVISIIDSGL